MRPHHLAWYLQFISDIFIECLDLKNFQENSDLPMQIPYSKIISDKIFIVSQFSKNFRKCYD